MLQNDVNKETKPHRTNVQMWSVTIKILKISTFLELWEFLLMKKF